MMICKNCGTENAGASNFCSSCGSQLIKEEKQESTERSVSKVKKKVNVSELQFSAKMGYYTRKIAIIYVLLVMVCSFLFVLAQNFSVFTTSNTDAAGFGLLGLLIFLPIFLAVVFAITIPTIVFGIILPSVWIEKNKKVEQWVEVLRIIGLVVCYISMIAPIVILIFKLL